MITIKNITMKNFMSVGNVSQAINLHNNDITLVLGENLDLGGNDNRNGCGKTTILNALSYALFGEPLTKIKMANLINKVNGKHMAVTVSFSKDGIDYMIERGRKPDTFSFINSSTPDENDNNAQGESRITQVEIEKLLGFNHLMFKHIIALNTYTTPFLNSAAGDQREIIETLLGINALSEKAEILKTKIKDTKTTIKDAERVIKNNMDFNTNIRNNVSSIQRKSDMWVTEKENKLQKLATALVSLEELDIDAEIHKHDTLAIIRDLTAKKTPITQAIASLKRTLSEYKTSEAKMINDLEKYNNNKCPSCDQELHDHDELMRALSESLLATMDKISQTTLDIETATELLNEIPEIPASPHTFYKDIKDAMQHKHTTQYTLDEILKVDESINPYADQISTLLESIIEIDNEEIETLTSLLDHQEFLLKLLTNKDSFIRKKIITQNINFLNERLEYYLTKIGLQHLVKFQPDLEVEITYMGKDLDFDNLSRGERTRLILALSWSFRDAYESLNNPINIMFVDELIDTGLDPSGVECSLSILKNMVRSGKKSIFLISHRDELLGRIDTTLKVVKENGFTSFEGQ